MLEFHPSIFSWILCYFGLPFRALVVYHLENGGMPFYEEVGVHCKKGATTDVKAQVPSILGLLYVNNLT